MDSHLPSIKDPQVETKVRNLCFNSIPNWSKILSSPKGIRLTKLEDGITNILYLVRLPLNKMTQEPNSCLCRLYGEKTEVLIDRKREMNIVNWLQASQLAAPIYFSFKTGVLYGFVEGQPLSDIKLLHDKQIYTRIATEMARLHSLSFDTKIPLSKNPPKLFFDRLIKWEESLPSDWTKKSEKHQKTFQLIEDLFVDKSIRSHITTLSKFFAKMPLKTSFTHCDLLGPNIVHQPKNDCVRFIDWEYGMNFYSLFDIGNHFWEWTGFEFDTTKFPSQEEMVQFVRIYLLKIEEFSGKNSPVTDSDIKTTITQVNHFVMLSHFLWALWALVQAANSTIDFDFMTYSFKRFSFYLEMASDRKLLTSSSSSSSSTSSSPSSSPISS